MMKTAKLKTLFLERGLDQG